MKTISEKVSRLRLEAYLGQIVLKVGLESLIMSPDALDDLFRHLSGRERLASRAISLFVMGLPPTLQCQNGNYLLANYAENTVAKLTAEKNSDGLRITAIQFAAPETEEDFNR